jgi:RimJ/RimL family protein N-acetyltransferase
MLREAVLSDIPFVRDLVAIEAATGVFERKLALPAARNGFELELRSIVTYRRRLNGLSAQLCIWQPARTSEPIGFVALSAGEGNKGNELWLAGISPPHRRKGHCSAMLNELLNQFKGRNLMLIARCSAESEIMFQHLLKNGFRHVATGDTGYRGLIFAL